MIKNVTQNKINPEEYYSVYTYKMVHWSEYNYDDLRLIPTVKTKGKKPVSVSKALIMFDTETTKLYDNPTVLTKKGVKILPVTNAVVAFTVSIRYNHRNIVTLYGNRPSELVNCMSRIRERITGEVVLFYAHNLAYDYTFMRQYFMGAWDRPEKQLATKPHYPVSVEYANGITLRDSLAIAQRKLERWAKDMNVEHQKAVGKWDYTRHRTQDETFTPDELTYIENDTLAGVECLDKLLESLGIETLYKIYTATGIPRRDVKKIGKEHYANKLFKRVVPSFDTYCKLVSLFHGGFTHANRNIVGTVIKGPVEDRDETSAYPYVMLGEKFPMTQWLPAVDATPEEVLSLKDKYAFIFKFTATNIRLKDPYFPMPVLQKSKAIELSGYSEDNGRILCADFYSCYLTETDLITIREFYDWDTAACTEVDYSVKGYLPKWFTDYIYNLYYEKSTLKGIDDLLYMLSKARLNSMFGLCATQSIKEVHEEDYDTGEYKVKEQGIEEIKAEYEEYCKSYSEVLPFSWGVYVTSYAMRNLFLIQNCIDYEHGGIWCYSDTDSLFATKWDENKLKTYNDACVDKLRANGYEPVQCNGKTYKLGTATSDSVYTEFITLGAKKYCGRRADTGELYITVSGVPKRGVKELNSIHDFADGMVFHGAVTGKLTHTYFFSHMRVEDGYEVADSIDLNPCDYLLSEIERDEEFLNREIYIPFFEED